jgi:RimJ/RimL family protein N-acetyltransferase
MTETLRPATTVLSLHSRRLHLRRWRAEDLEPFARLSADPLVMEYLMPLPDRAASDALAGRIDEHFTRHGFGYWAVEVPGVCPFIGFVGLARVSYEAHFTPAVEIGWRIDPAYWGQGYATEAAATVLSDGFTRLGLEEIVALTVTSNQRSRRVMERLAMTRAESDDFDHPMVPAEHPLRRHVVYRLRREGWRAAD